MSVITAVREYINKMLSEVLGMKALLMDADTIGIVSMVYSQSESNAKEVFLFQGIEVDKKAEVSHLKAVCFLRPTAANIASIITHLRTPRFAEYHLYFSNIVPKSFLKQIAEADDHEVVRSVQEYFADFFAVNSDLFTLNIANTRLLCAPNWGPAHASTFGRIIDGLSSTLLSFKKAPVIRYLTSSDLCKRVATELTARTKEENGLFDFPRSDGEPLLLILDRRMDPVTPLLMQWSYQALVHELLGLHNHRVDLSGVSGVQKEFKEVVLSPEADHFFKGVMFQNWGDVASQIHELLSQYARQNKDNRKMQTFEEMKDFVENYPQFKQLQTNACKHMTVATELHRKIEVRRLLEVCELEQELACVDSHSNSVEKLLQLLNDSRLADSDKLRCALLYALRYETVRNELPTIKSILRSKAKDAKARARIELIDMVLEYAGADVRGTDLFSNQTVASKAAKFFELFSSDFQGADSALTMHKPYLNQVISQINDKSMKSTEFPFVEGDPKRQFNHKFVIIFIVGGATYGEAAAVAALNAANPNQRIVLGGTTIHNSDTFLEDVSSGFHTAVDIGDEKDFR